MSNTFKQLIKILNEAGVSPAREGQVETEEGVIYDDAASITYTDEDGFLVVINSKGEIFSNGAKVAEMAIKEDAWYQAQEMIWIAKQYAF